MTMKDLVRIINEAIQSKVKYFGIRVENDVVDEYEIIINKCENLDHKIAYYINAYNDKLELKKYSEIKIVDACYADDFMEIERLLCN